MRSKKRPSDLAEWIALVRDWMGRGRDGLDELRNSRPFARLYRAHTDFEALTNSSLDAFTRGAKARYDAFAMVMDRFYVTGVKRLLVEGACEAFTISIGGGLVLLALALPAFQIANEDGLKKQDLAITFLDRYGEEVGRRGIRHDDAVPFDELPPNLIHAVIATEDRRFFEHFGIDIIGTMRALTVNTRANGVVQGGSSLTQQLAKNLFLSNERTIQRKVNEAFLALWLEWHLTKRQILTLYLDRAYLGGGTFGVQAASEFYFGKSVRDLTLPECAMIAGLFKAPTKYAPHINLPAARARANDVLNNMVDAGYLTAGQIYAAQRNPATPVDRPRNSSPDWYLDWAYNEVKALADSGKFGNENVLTVRTGLDPSLQQYAEDTVENELRQSGPQYNAHQSAVVVLDPLGAVRAIVGGRDYGSSQFNRATDAMRQPGSSFKPYVYLTALMSGRFKPDTRISGAPICIGNWCPHNYDDETAGNIPLVVGLMRSLNTVAVRLSVEIGDATPGASNIWSRAKSGRMKIIQTARRMGITTPLPDTVSLPLGADAVKVIEQAGAYAAFANGGRRATPYATVSVSNGRGDVLFEHDRDGPKAEQVIDPNAIAMMNTMLHQVVLGGTGRAANLEGFNVSGKTGTTNDYHDAWFVGFTGNLVAAVWYGNDDYESMNKMTGGSLPARTWHEIMAYAHQNLEPKPVPGLPPVAPAKPAADKADGVASLAPKRPPTLSKASVEALGKIAGAMHVVALGHAGGRVQGMTVAPAQAAPMQAITDADSARDRIVGLR